MKPILSKEHDYWVKVKKGISVFIVQRNRVGEKPKIRSC